MMQVRSKARRFSRAGVMKPSSRRDSLPTVGSDQNANAGEAKTWKDVMRSRKLRQSSFSKVVDVISKAKAQSAKQADANANANTNANANANVNVDANTNTSAVADTNVNANTDADDNREPEEVAKVPKAGATHRKVRRPVSPTVARFRVTRQKLARARKSKALVGALEKVTPKEPLPEEIAGATQSRVETTVL